MNRMASRDTQGLPPHLQTKKQKLCYNKNVKKPGGGEESVYHSKSKILIRETRKGGLTGWNRAGGLSMEEGKLPKTGSASHTWPRERGKPLFAREGLVMTSAAGGINKKAAWLRKRKRDPASPRCRQRLRPGYHGSMKKIEIRCRPSRVPGKRANAERRKQGGEKRALRGGVKAGPENKGIWGAEPEKIGGGGGDSGRGEKRRNEKPRDSPCRPRTHGGAGRRRM